MQCYILCLILGIIWNIIGYIEYSIIIIVIIIIIIIIIYYYYYRKRCGVAPQGHQFRRGVAQNLCHVLAAELLYYKMADLLEGSALRATTREEYPD
jgi:heme/copper-type cytochrome/quinol oxidase subunit 2